MLCAAWGMGCSIAPVQHQVTGIKTVDLVAQIRCETRLAVAEIAADRLARRSDPRSQAAAAEIRADPVHVSPQIRRRLDSAAQSFYDRYMQVAIALEFSFDITEENGSSVSVDPVRLMTRGTLGAGLDAGGTFNRSNLRRFIFSETFRELLGDEILVEKCGNYHLAPNFSFPISGNIGLFEVIDSFVELNQTTELSAFDKGNDVFASTMKFTTLISGSVAPAVVLNPAGKAIGLTSALFTASAKRQDVHQLIVGLSFPPKQKAAEIKRGGTVVPYFAAPAAPTTTGRKQQALDAISDHRSKTFLDRFGSVPLR